MSHKVEGPAIRLFLPDDSYSLLKNGAMWRYRSKVGADGFTRINTSQIRLLASLVTARRGRWTSGLSMRGRVTAALNGHYEFCRKFAVQNERRSGLGRCAKCHPDYGWA